MAKKRGNSEGTIHQLPSGSWRAQLSLQGHRLSHTSKTRREVQEWLKQQISQIDGGYTYTYAQLSIQEYMNEWLKTKQSVIRPSSWTQFKQITRCYIIPWLGSVKLTQLRTDQVQRLYNHLIEIGVQVYAIRKCHTVLHSALQNAVRIGVINRNPVSYAQQPRLPSHEIHILDEGQTNWLIVSTRDHRLGALINLAIASGARQRELLGLKWTDIDWVKKTLRIDRQLDFPDGNGVHFSDTKTKYGRRSIVLGSHSIEVLKEQMVRQEMERRAAGSNWRENGLIFTTSIGTPIHPRNLLRDFKILLKEAGLPPIRWHDLRHLCASILLNKNISPIVVARRLGHSKTSITMDVYGHLIGGMQNEAAEIIDEVITPLPIEANQIERKECAPKSLIGDSS